MEVPKSDVSRSIWVTSALNYKVLDIVFADGEVEVAGEHGLDVAGIDVLLFSLVEQFKAFSGLVVLAALAPFLGYEVLDLIELNSVSLENVAVSLLELLVNFFLCHSVEAEVVEDVAEVLHRYHVFIIFVVKLECVLEV